MADKISTKQHKVLLDEALASNVTYKYLEGKNPCRIMLDGNYFNIYIKNLSSAHFSNENVWRAQLPSNDEFIDMKESPIPFIFLGYDMENDVYATWNPNAVKQRLNEVVYVSFYSRLSSQVQSREENRFIRESLNNDGEVLIFPREKLSSYLVNCQTYFPDTSDYVAMGSKRRTEANEAYRALNDSKNLSPFAKYLEQQLLPADQISTYCKIIKYLLNGEFSHNRKDFLACDTIFQYDSAIDRFLLHPEIQELDMQWNNALKEVLSAYIAFLKCQFENQEENEENEEPDDVDTIVTPEDETPSDTEKSDLIDWESPYYKDGLLTKLTNPEILHLIEPVLNTEYKAPIVAVNKIKDFYADKLDLSKMQMKDWLKLINAIDWATAYVLPAPKKETTHRKKTHFLRVTFSDGRVLQHRNSARTFARVIEECYPDLIAEMNIMVAGVNVVMTEQTGKYAGALMPIADGKYFVMTNISTPSKRDILEQIANELELDYKAELVPIEQFVESTLDSDLPSASRKRIRVTFPDGRVIENARVHQTLIDVIEYAGSKQVEELDYNMAGQNIVTNNLSVVKEQTKYKPLSDGYYINTGSSTHDKYKQIQYINHALGLGLKIELI